MKSLYFVICNAINSEYINKLTIIFVLTRLFLGFLDLLYKLMLF